MMDDDEIERVSLVRSYLQLLRLPNIFTAMADAAMGLLFIEADWAWNDAGGLRPLGLWALGVIVAASSLLYAGGVVLNDVFDLERDREERPERPLPSGRVSLRTARWLGWDLLLLGAMLPCGVAVLLHRALPGADLGVAVRPAAVALILALAIVLYNTVLKPTLLGPLAMGACRMLNVLLGMSVLRGPLGPEHWLVAGAIGVYITGVTWFARDESQRSDRRQLAGAMMFMMAGVAMLAWLPRWSENLNWMIRQDPQQWYLLMALLGGIIGLRSLWAIALPVPGRVRVAIAQAILSLVFLDAAACYAVRGPYWAAMILLLLLPAVFFGRWIAST